MRFLFLLSLIFFSWSCQEKKSGVLVKEISGPVFGSTYSIKYVGNLDREVFSTYLQEFFRDFNAEFSTYQENSVISQFNLAPAGMKIKVNQRFISMLKLLRKFHEVSEGAFDPTLGPVIKAWGFDKGKPGRPSESVLTKARSLMGLQHVYWDEASDTAWKTKGGLTLDLNAFAPGWAADLIGEELLRRGVDNFMVDIGGEILVRGKKGDESWVIGIEKPSEGVSHVLQMAIRVKDLAVATSGNYRQFFLEDGVRRSHILDPRTGLPVEHTVASVTILAPSAVEADVWGTVLMVLGEKGTELARKQGVRALFIRTTGPGKFDTSPTPEMKTYLEANQL